MTDSVTKCVSCGQPLSERTQERGFKRCYACYQKDSQAQQ